MPSSIGNDGLYCMYVQRCTLSTSKCDPCLSCSAVGEPERLFSIKKRCNGGYILNKQPNNVTCIACVNPDMTDVLACRLPLDVGSESKSNPIIHVFHRLTDFHIASADPTSYARSTDVKAGIQYNLYRVMHVRGCASQLSMCD